MRGIRELFFALLLVGPMGMVNAITKGINFFGFETDTKVVHMLWCQPLEWHIQKIAETGFNSIRMPVSEDFIMSDWNTEYPKDGVINPTFPQHGMKSIEILDEIFRLTAEKNISIIFDIHRLYDSQQSPKPFIDYTIYTFVRFMDAWVKLLQRYQSQPNLLGVDVFNEYQSDNWQDWKNLAEITINHIENTIPDRFQYYVEGSRWGGDLSGANKYPLQLAPHIMPRVFYSIHKYHFSDSNFQWNQAGLNQSWDFSFGFLKDRVMVGEWGYISSDRWQSQWAAWFVDYLRDRGVTNTYFWSWNFDSGDTQGVVMENCQDLNSDKIRLLHQLWA